jgi:hypothetical protein
MSWLLSIEQQPLGFYPEISAWGKFWEMAHPLSVAAAFQLIEKIPTEIEVTIEDTKSQCSLRFPSLLPNFF